MQIVEYSKVCKFLLHISMVCTYMLIGNISEIYTYVLFDVSVDYTCVIVYFVRSCSNIIRLHVIRVI